MNRDPINRYVMERTGGRVAAGPFRGMRILAESGWGDGDITPKLLGVYEQELHAAILEASTQQYGAVVNIGSAEGYYVIGLAMICRPAPFYAFEISEGARSILARNASLNGVGERIQMRAACGPPDLVALARQHGRLLIVCDCEGYEMPLFSDPEVVASLRDSDVIVECHDFIDPACTPTVLGKLWRTHHINIIYSGGRDPGSIPMLARYSDVERWTAICENRPSLMNWLICRPR